jgi:uncharacterized damage-inducible protein DinB
MYMSENPRVSPPIVADERDMLIGWLDFHRATLALKCDGLSDEQLRERSVQPSSLSLLGLVRHMADVERGWFRQTFADEDVPDLYYREDDRDADFNHVATADVAESFQIWSTECEVARQIVAAEPSFDTLAKRQVRGDLMSLRWIMVHMIEEYARHNGHADLLRERIDGVTGD